MFSCGSTVKVCFWFKLNAIWNINLLKRYSRTTVLAWLNGTTDAVSPDQEEKVNILENLIL